MTKQYAIIRVEKHKKGSISAVSNHNYRQGNIETNIKKEKTKDNILLFGSNNVKSDINEYIEKTGIKPRNKDTVLFQEFILTASPDFFFNNKDGTKKTKEQYEKNLNDWIKTQVDYLNKNTYGVCVNAVVHLDESTPHIHAVVLPIKDGKFNCKAFYRGKNSYSKLLDQYALHNKRHGLERGSEESLADHTTLKEYRELAQSHMSDIERRKRNISSKNKNLVSKETGIFGLEKKYSYEETTKLIKKSNEKTLNAYSFYKHNYAVQYNSNIVLEKQNTQQKQEIKNLSKKVKDLTFQINKIKSIDQERDYYYNVLKQAKEALSDILQHPFKTIKDLKDFLDYAKKTKPEPQPEEPKPLEEIKTKLKQEEKPEFGNQPLVEEVKTKRFKM